jgi:hypothetical protein
MRPSSEAPSNRAFQPGRDALPRVLNGPLNALPSLTQCASSQVRPTPNSTTIGTSRAISGRYKSLVVDEGSPGYLKAACDYVHLNPVRAKLLKPEQLLKEYRWSSWPE